MERIPDFNMLASLIDRLSIENVKLADFENAIEHDKLSDYEIAEFQKNVMTQNEIIRSLKNDLASLMEDIFLSGKYDNIKEERTFEQRIPNFNTLSTLIDRLSIENVKLVHFKNEIYQGNLPDDKILKFKKKIAVQHEIISALKKELTLFIKKGFLSGKYEYMKEERTFT